MSQKLENILNLALETSESVRMQTENLNIGFDTDSRTWELIVKYHGSLDALTALNVQVEYLIAGYAILTVPEAIIETVSNLEEIEYVEKPKRYFYQQTAEVAESSCIYPLTRREPYLTGEGVLIAVLDSGIAYGKSDFRKEDGTTRILYLWDQTTSEGQPPEGFSMGTEYTEEQMGMFRVRPGITGWAQIHGRKDVEWNLRIRLNNWYIDHMSLWLDIRILFMTFFKVLTNADNANEGATVIHPSEIPPVTAPTGSSVSSDNTDSDNTDA